ncbi:MAG: hypothetical protein ACJ8R9_03410 [Steroidobacteraceae bacterium]
MKRSIAKHTALSLTCVGLLTAGAAFAQQASPGELSRPVPNRSATPSSAEPMTPAHTASDRGTTANGTMKDCIDRERAKDSNLSESKAKKACHEQMKAQKQNPDYQPRPR